VVLVQAGTGWSILAVAKVMMSGRLRHWPGVRDAGLVGVIATIDVRGALIAPDLAIGLSYTGPPQQVAFVFAHAATDPVRLACPQREPQALAPDTAPCTDYFASVRAWRTCGC
jgi:hypothetical protein